jgi:Cell division protein FtsQ/DivIB, C-terminal
VSSRRRTPRRRYRVVARPRARARRLRLAAAAGAVGLLGLVAAAVLRHAGSALLARAKRLPAALAGGPARVSVAAPAPLRALAQAAADAAPGSAGDQAAVIEAKFPCVSDVRVRRDWGSGTATLTVVLRSARAPALRRGRPAGFLGADGAVFTAPRGVYALSGPSVDVAGAPPAELKALAAAWPQLTAPGALPAPLSEMLYRSPADGWEARLTDGTTVLWGGLNWTRQKLARLAEALADARAKTPQAGAFAADLRWFADGKVVLRPLSGRDAALAARGGRP